MIPFDLTKAKLGLPMRTRNGWYTAKFIAYLDGGQPAPLVVEVDSKLENYYLDGRHNEVHESPLDLFMQY